MSYRHPYLCCLCLLLGCLKCQTTAGTPTEDGKGTHQACLQHSQFHNESRDDNPHCSPFQNSPEEELNEEGVILTLVSVTEPTV